VLGDGGRSFFTEIRVVCDALGAVSFDIGWDSDDSPKYVVELKTEAVIPTKKNRTVQRPLSPELYKYQGRPNVNSPTWSRRIATRYENATLSYGAVLHFVAAMVGL
jgi:hypothetical protein